MRVSVNVKFETPDDMEMVDFADYVAKAIVDFSIKTKCNLESSKIKELVPKED